MPKQRCWNCRSERYENTISREHCPSCGIECDYHGAGANEAYTRATDARHYAEQKARDDEEFQWRRSQGEW